jgi:hypothetical protein
MTSTEQCLTQIAGVFEAAADPRAAYLIRSRLRRAILSCARLVAQAAGADKPVIPGVFPAPSPSSRTDAEIIALCNRVYATARELCQPSESFDVRWESGWRALSVQLEQLQAALVRRRIPASVV